jgi:hypothetical protein
MMRCDYSTITKNNATINGDYNNIKGDYNTIIGDNNNIKGDYNNITGNNNDIKGDYNSHNGLYNDVKDDYNYNQANSCINDSTIANNINGSIISNNSIFNISGSNDLFINTGNNSVLNIPCLPPRLFVTNGTISNMNNLTITNNSGMSNIRGIILMNNPIMANSNISNVNGSIIIGRSISNVSNLNDNFNDREKHSIEKKVKLPDKEDEISVNPDDFKPEEICNICMEHKINTVIVDCGHRIFCINCSHQYKDDASPTCPICRKAITHIIKIY